MLLPKLEVMNQLVAFEIEAESDAILPTVTEDVEEVSDAEVDDPTVTVTTDSGPTPHEFVACAE